MSPIDPRRMRELIKQKRRAETFRKIVPGPTPIGERRTGMATIKLEDDWLHQVRAERPIEPVAIADIGGAGEDALASEFDERDEEDFGE